MPNINAQANAKHQRASRSDGLLFRNSRAKGGKCAAPWNCNLPLVPFRRM